MREALRLARKGLGRVSPNPMVGALVVRGDTVLGKGYHREFGGTHAEVNALRDAKGETRGATLYVTLEPCSHHGKTPPCVDLIIERGVSRVVVGTRDPNPLVPGRGIDTLQAHGIQVTTGVLEKACRELNDAFFKFCETGLPFVTLKMVQSLDGRIATKRGDSQWISSRESRRMVHRWRAIHDGVMVGIGTILTDDPSLTVRLVRGRSPHRLIVDSTLRIPRGAKVLVDGKAPTTIVTTDRADSRRIQELESLGVRVLSVDSDPQGRVDLETALRRLATKGMTSILVEGGSRLATSLLEAGLADRLTWIIGPRILGEGKAAVGDLGIEELSQAIRLHIEKMRRIGGDLIVFARLDSRQ